MLSDVEIREALHLQQIKIIPEPKDSDIQPASIDVHLGNRFGFLSQPPMDSAVLLSDKSVVRYGELDELILRPGDFVLGQLAEWITLDAWHVARIEGKSSIGRKGVAIHVTAGFVDPGWDGILTVEMFNASNVTYILRPGDAIGQVAFDKLVRPSARPYGHKDLGSHYQGSKEVRGS